MGLFSNLFGKKEELATLDPASPAAKRLDKFKAELETFVGKMNDRLEFVPADEAVYWVRRIWQRRDALRFPALRS